MKRKQWFWVAVFGAVALAVTFGTIWAAYSHDMRIIRERVSRQSQLVQTRHGLIEFTDWGNGPVVLVVHGAGTRERFRATARARRKKVTGQRDVAPAPQLPTLTPESGWPPFPESVYSPRSA